jgi:transcriptional regulator with XRE-family HTH domain
MSEQESFIKRLYLLLEETNTTQRELAEKVNVTEVTISRYLSGERNPRIEIVNKIAKYFKVSVDYLLGRTDIRSTNLDTSEDKEFISFYEGYKDLDDAHKEILKATLKAFVDAKKGDK